MTQVFLPEEQYPLFVGEPLGAKTDQVVMSQWFDFPTLRGHLVQLAFRRHANDPLRVAAQRPAESITEPYRGRAIGSS